VGFEGCSAECGWPQAGYGLRARSTNLLTPRRDMWRSSLRVRRRPSTAAATSSGSIFAPRPSQAGGRAAPPRRAGPGVASGRVASPREMRPGGAASS